MRYPEREQPVVGVPAPSEREPLPQRWYVVTEDATMSLRLVPGAVLCEGFDGNLVTCVEEAAHAARFDIVDEELWVTCVAGQIAADGENISQIAHLMSGTRLTVGQSSYFIAESLTELTGPMPVLVTEDQDEPATQDGPRLFYDEPTTVEEIVISEPAARPHLVAARDGRTGQLPESTVPDQTPPPMKASDAAASETPTQFFQTPPIRDARSTAKSRFPATALLIIALLAALGFAGYKYVDPEQLRGWWSAALAEFETWRASDADATPRLTTAEADLSAAAEPAPSATEPRQPFDLIKPDTLAESAEPARVDETTQTASDPRFDALTAFAWLRDISPENHERFLELASSLLSSADAPPLHEHVRYYVSRLGAIEDGAAMKTYAESFGAVFAPHGAYRAIVSELEARVFEANNVATEYAERLARLERRASELFDRGALTLPPGDNVVAIANNMLQLDASNPAAINWLNRTASVMVSRAQSRADEGDEFAARNILEDVLAFAPRHRGARQLQNELSQPTAG